MITATMSRAYAPAGQNLWSALLLLLCVFCWHPAPASAATTGRGDWWMFHHDAQHTGRSSFTGPNSPAMKWAFTTRNTVSSSPAIASDGTIYVGSDDFNLYAINADGSKKWACATGRRIDSSPAIGADGTIYVGSEGIALCAINPDGTQKWAKTIGVNSNEVSSPAVGTDGTIYIGAYINGANYNQYTGKLFAFSPDGTQKWAYTIGNLDYYLVVFSPAVGTDGTIYVGAGDNNLYAINPDGTQKWCYPCGSAIGSDPSIGADGTIYVGLQSGLLAINTNGKQKWAYYPGSWIAATPAIGADGTIYDGSRDDFFALNPDGTVKWKLKGGAGFNSPAIGADGTIYYGQNDLYAISPNGTKKWAITAGEGISSSPVIGANGIIYVGSFDNNLYAITSPSLTLTKTVSPSNAPPSAIITYTLTYCAIATASNVILTDTLPTKVGYVTGSASSGGSYTAGTLTWNLGNLSTGAVKSVTFKATINADIAASTIIANTAMINCTEIPTPVISNMVAVTVIPSTVTITPTAGANGRISPNTPQTVRGGSSLTFTVSANAGYTVDAWSLDTVPVQNGGATYTLPYITANHAVKVTFKINPTPPIRGDWWMFHHDPQHTGRSSFTGPGIPTQKWAFPTGDFVYSSPAIGADGTVYAGSADGHLYAINPDGTRKWGFATGSSCYAAFPALDVDGTIYIVTGSFQSFTANLYAVNPDGTKKWSFAFGGTLGSAPAVGTDRTIYVGSQDHNLYAINSDGTKKWAFTTGGAVDSPALGADGMVYVGSDADHSLYAVNPDGTRKWVFATGGEIHSSPALGADGTIYIGSMDGNLYAIHPDGTKKWAFTAGNPISSIPALGADGMIYFGSDDGIFNAINPDGSRKWGITVGGMSFPALGADGTIYVGTDNLNAINPDGTKKWTFAASGTLCPALGANSTIYVGSSSGKLYAIGAALPTTITPSAGPYGTISPNTAQTVAIGSNVMFTAAPATGYTVDSWQLDGKTIQTGGAQYTVKTVAFTANSTHTLKVTFKPLPFTTTPSAGPNGKITPNTPQTVTFGNSIAFTATANAGYTTDTWYLDNVAIQTGGSLYTLKNITANHAVKVTFMPPPVLSVKKSVSASLAISGATVTYSLTYANTGGRATGMILTDSLPSRVTYVPNSATGNSNYVASKLTWSLGTLNAGASATVSFKATVNANTPVGTNVVNTAALSCVELAKPVVSNAAVFTVAANSLPDLAICNYSENTYTGFTVINLDGTNQTKSQSVAPKASANYLFQVKNAGSTTDTFALTIPPAPSGWTVKVVLGSSNDVTTAITSSTGFTVTLAPGALATCTLHVTPSAYVCGTLRLAITAVSAGDTTKKDVVKAGVTVAAPAQPDLSLCNAGDSLYLGGGILNLDGTNQSKSQAVASVKVATYLFRVQNAGTMTDSYTLTCPLPSLSGWTVKCLDSTGKDVTTAFTGAAGSKTAALAPGALAIFTLQVTPGIAAVSGKPYALLITAASTKDATKKDAVKAVTTKP